MTKAKHPGRRSGSTQGDLTPSGRHRSSRAYDPRSIASPGQGLGDLHPDLASRALYCPQYPDIPVNRLRLQSNMRFYWLCQCGGVTHPLKVMTVVSRGAVICDRCQRTGKSRLEFEVAEVLRLMLGIDVYTHYGPTRRDQVDLYIPSLDTAIELDPQWSHRHREKSDVARLAQHSAVYDRVFRVRDERLPSIPECPSVPPRAPASQWAATICDSLGVYDWQEPSADEIARALKAAAVQFRNLQTSPPERSLADVPDIAVDFIENLTVPNQTPEWISIGSGDLCRWRCSAGLHGTYTQTVDKRTGPQAVGCSPCGRMRIAAARRRPSEGRSAAHDVPELLEYFVINLSSRTTTLYELRPNSHDECLWRCANEACENMFKDTVKGRRARPAAVCGDCRSIKTWASRRNNPQDPVNIQWRLGLIEFAAHTALKGHGRVPENTVTASGFKLGGWVRRARRATLTKSQRSDLLTLDHWSDDPRADTWWRAYALLQQYVLREGHARVPAKHIEDGYTLGLYVGKQRRQHHLRRLSARKIQLLETLPGWAWRLRSRRSDAGDNDGFAGRT